MAMFDRFRKKKAVSAKPPQPTRTQFPPVPEWRPSFGQPIELVKEHASSYVHGQHDFAVFEHGTVAYLADGLSDTDAVVAATSAIEGVLYAHPDMNPVPMEDGNVFILFANETAVIVLSSTVSENATAIEENHLLGLIPDEVLFTPLGANTFDQLGQVALYGRSLMFLDAQEPRVVSIVRKAA